MGETIKRLFPVMGGSVSTGFWDLRPYSLPASQRTYIHRAWDLVGPTKTAPILAPEDGHLFYHYAERCPLTRQRDQTWPDSGKWYMFSNFYADSMGAVAVLVGKESEFIYAFCHIDVDMMFDWLNMRDVPYMWQKSARAYDDYVRWVITYDAMESVNQGEVIGYIGDAGYSTGHHTHMQIHVGRWYDRRLDPASIWPNMDINDNGRGPSKGPRPDAEYIPAKDLPLDFIRPKA